jgi:Domain of unknown function (DUF4389)
MNRRRVNSKEGLARWRIIPDRMEDHPVRMEIEDDLRRSRLTVFFRLLLAIPHFVWVILWSIAAVVVAVINWFAALFTGRSPEGLHNFLAAYVRYVTHLYAYLLLAANPYPGFTGEPRSYPIDVLIDPPAPQRRWVTALRIFLALPALALASTLVGSCSGGGSGGQSGSGGAEDAAYFFSGGGVAITVAVLAWFLCLARGRMPGGFRDLVAYALRYNAQALAYVLLVTDRFPNSDPADRTPHPPPERPINLEVEDDRRRSRLTVFFRLLLALPHLVWLLLWTVLVVLVAIVNWFITLFAGRSPEAFHRFLSAYVRYDIHVFAFLFLVANPFPGFTGQAGTYPIDVRIEPRARQNRWITGFRALLAIPALLVTGALDVTLFVAGVLGWFAALATGRMPTGLRNLGAFVLRYSAQTNGYIYLLTDRYPYSGPLLPAEPEEEEPPPAAAFAEPA